MSRVAPLPAPLASIPRPSSQALLHPANTNRTFHVSLRDVPPPQPDPIPGRGRRTIRALFRLLGRRGAAAIHRGFLQARTVCLNIGEHVYSITNQTMNGQHFTEFELGEVARRLLHVEADTRRRRLARGLAPAERHDKLCETEEVQTLEFEVDRPDTCQSDTRQLPTPEPEEDRPMVRDDDQPRASSQHQPFASPQDAACVRPWRPFYTFYHNYTRYNIENPSATDAIPQVMLLDVMDIISGYAKGEDQGGKVRGIGHDEIEWSEMTNVQRKFYNENKLYEEEKTAEGFWFCVALDENTYGRGIGKVFFVCEDNSADPGQ